MAAVRATLRHLGRGLVCSAPIAAAALVLSTVASASASVHATALQGPPSSAHATVVDTTWTTTVIAAAPDEVSAAIAALFGAHGQAYHSLADQAGSFHDQFVQLLGDEGGSIALDLARRP
jgi:PE family